MATKKYYWLKLKNDFFTNKKIKKLRKIAGGDTYTIIYLKMQLLSIKDGGKLFFENVEDSFAEELALELDEDVENVKVTLIFLIKNGLLIEVNTEEFVLPETIECIGSETNKAELMRRKRAKEKIKGNNVTTMLPPVTNCYTEKEKEKEIDKDKSNSKNKKNTYFQNENINSIFIEFLEVRRKLKAVNSERAITTLINKLNQYDDETKYQMIENSIVNSWKGIYESKQQKNHSNQIEKKLPDWFNKESEIKPMTPEQIEEMESFKRELKEKYGGKNGQRKS